MGQLEPALDSDRGEDDNELLAIFAMLNRALLPATGAHRSRPGLQYDNPSGDSFPRVLKCHVAPREWEMETLLQAAFQQDGSQIKGEVIVPVEVRGALRHLAGERFRPKSGRLRRPRTLPFTEQRDRPGASGQQGDTIFAISSSFRCHRRWIIPLFFDQIALLPRKETARLLAKLGSYRHENSGRLRYAVAERPKRAVAASAHGIITRMIVHVVDGTYELFRHFYGLRRFSKGQDRPFGGVIGVLQTLLQLIEQGATHLGVATDHIIESFRNRIWPGYKTGSGIEPALLAQFHPLEEALSAMGITVWPMTELEADDALASAARIAAEDQRVQKICIWTPDKDLAQCVRGERVVQMDRRGKKIRDAEGVREKFGVEPVLIPDFLALVGDVADGYPGISGIGSITAAQLLNRYGMIENFPPALLGDRRDRALLFKHLATLRTDAALFRNVDELRWCGPTDAFASCTERMGAPRLLERCLKAQMALDRN